MINGQISNINRTYDGRRNFDHKIRKLEQILKPVFIDRCTKKMKNAILFVVIRNLVLTSVDYCDSLQT